MKIESDADIPRMPMSEIKVKFPIMYDGLMKAAGVIEHLIQGHDCGAPGCAEKHRPKLRELMDDLVDDGIRDTIAGLANKDSKTMDALRNKVIFGILKNAIEQVQSNQDPDKEPDEEAVAMARDLLAKISQPNLGNKH